MAEVAKFIGECNDNGQHPSQKTIEDGIKGKAEFIRTAIANLIKHGHVQRGLPGNRPYEHTLVNPYREPENQ
jgi:hypothetical protein